MRHGRRRSFGDGSPWCWLPDLCPFRAWPCPLKSNFIYRPDLWLSGYCSTRFVSPASRLLMGRLKPVQSIMGALTYKLIAALTSDYICLLKAKPSSQLCAFCKNTNTLIMLSVIYRYWFLYSDSSKEQFFVVCIVNMYILFYEYTCMYMCICIFLYI